MSEQLTPDEIMHQMAILIYNQPQVQQALTNITASVRSRENLTATGVELVEAVQQVAMAFAADPDALKAALDAAPRTLEAAGLKPGTYPATTIQRGDIISHGVTEHRVTNVVAGRDSIQIVLENGAVLDVQPQTQIHLIKPGA